MSALKLKNSLKSLLQQRRLFVGCTSGEFGAPDMERAEDFSHRSEEAVVGQSAARNRRCKGAEQKAYHCQRRRQTKQRSTA